MSLLQMETPEHQTLMEKDHEDLQRHDSMPDLTWPEKKSSEMSNITSSESHDTGFGSDIIGDAPSPMDDKSISEAVDQIEAESSVTGDDTAGRVEEELEEEMDILGNGLLVKKLLKINSSILKNFSAFDLAVALMEMGEKCELSTAPRYAYGDQGRDPDIPKNATITYTMEILKIEPAVEPSLMSYDQRLKFGEAKRERGNYLFGRGDFTGAITSYGKATKLLDNSELNAGLDEASRASLSDTWVKCYNNMAACQLKIDALDAAIRSCEKVIATQGDNVKALFRLGKAYGAKGNIDLAISYLRKAIKLDPESKMLHQEMLKLSRRKTKEAATEKELYQRMLGIKPGQKSLNGDKDKQKNSSNLLMKWTLLGGTVAAVIASVGWTWYRTSWS
ncbi:peptidylprolyl isomerase [Elysia marginata]|uniref:peptidylprolyl isomerase n=1 Tax=Elysia marginata TaxID=1093978 RepID=A0AAV4I7I9_9GAST|nr:peptidylprolyl isomerase [Elysia marginata]